MDDYEKLYFTVWHARAAMLRYCSRETCILATRIVAQIARDLLGHSVTPLAAGVLGLNPVALAKVLAGEDFAGVEGAIGLTCAHRGPDANAEPGEWWGGHLICLVDGRFLVDASADQFAHPEHDIIVPGPIVLGATGKDRDDLIKFAEGDQHMSFRLPGGGLLQYAPHPEDLSYMDSMDWEDTGPGDRLYDYVLQTVEGLLDLYGDAPQIPDLPELPRSFSKRDTSHEEVQRRDMRAVKELGYTPEELRVKIKREDEREKARRVAKLARGMERGAEIHQAIGKAATSAAAAGATLGVLLGNDPAKPQSESP